MPHPTDVPLEKWSPGWLAMECASLLDDPMFLMKHADERRAANQPSTEGEMREFIRARRSQDA